MPFERIPNEAGEMSGLAEESLGEILDDEFLADDMLADDLAELGRQLNDEAQEISAKYPAGDHAQRRRPPARRPRRLSFTRAAGVLLAAAGVAWAAALSHGTPDRAPVGKVAFAPDTPAAISASTVDRISRELEEFPVAAEEALDVSDLSHDEIADLTAEELEVVGDACETEKGQKAIKVEI